MRRETTAESEPIGAENGGGSDCAGTGNSGRPGAAAGQKRVENGKEQDENVNEKVLKVLREAEMVLIGIGSEFSPAMDEENSGAASGTNVPDEENSGAASGTKVPDEENSGAASETNVQAGAHNGSGQETDASARENNGAAPAGADTRLLELCRLSRYYEELPEDCAAIRAYNRLRELAGAKPYFVVTLNTDDLIYRSALEDDLIVAPCGSLSRMQCAEHIVEAAPIRDAVLAEGDVQKAVCPLCGKPLQFHTVEFPGYLEQGYLPQWQKYTKWLQCTLNRRLCILELGVDFRYPQVIRFPFEKTVYYNRKATLVRIGSRFPQLTEEIAERGISVCEDPVAFLLNL